jgi:hypothetical protein
MQARVKFDLTYKLLIGGDPGNGKPASHVVFPAGYEAEIVHDFGTFLTLKRPDGKQSYVDDWMIERIEEKASE